MPGDSMLPCPDYVTCYDPEWCLQGGPCDKAKVAHEAAMRAAEEQIQRWLPALKKLGEQ